MSSPKYLASVGNSTVCPPEPDESPIPPRSVESLDLSPAARKRLDRLCYEVYRTFLQYSNRGQLPDWDTLDEQAKFSHSGCIDWGADDASLRVCSMDNREQCILSAAVVRILNDWAHMLEHRDAPQPSRRGR